MRERGRGEKPAFFNFLGILEKEGVRSRGGARH